MIGPYHRSRVPAPPVSRRPTMELRLVDRAGRWLGISTRRDWLVVGVVAAAFAWFHREDLARAPWAILVLFAGRCAGRGGGGWRREARRRPRSSDCANPTTADLRGIGWMPGVVP